VQLPSIAAQVARGFAMGSADIVPGVSGGTVALVLRIYERLIDNIRGGAAALRRLLALDVHGFRAALREIEWVWLLSLLTGILLAVATLASVLESLLDDHPIPMAGLFLGLVAGAVVIAWRLLGRLDVATLSIMFAVGIAVFVLIGLTTDATPPDDAAEMVTQPAWVFFLAGALAICAMILPGISGSFILVLIGMYDEVLGAVNDRDLVPLAAMALGCVVGLALFSTLLSWMLHHHHDLVMAALIGLMVGSTRVLGPWPNGVETTTLAAPGDDVALTVVLCLVGFVVVLAVDAFGRQLTSDASRSIPSAMSASPSANENRA
jgi:putative membrane protein